MGLLKNNKFCVRLLFGLN